MNMNKIILALILALLVLAGCNSTGNETKQNEQQSETTGQENETQAEKNDQPESVEYNEIDIFEIDGELGRESRLRFDSSGELLFWAESDQGQEDEDRSYIRKINDETRLIEEKPVTTSIYFSPTGKLYFDNSDYGEKYVALKTYDFATDSYEEFPLPEEADEYTAVMVHPDYQVIAHEGNFYIHSVSNLDTDKDTPYLWNYETDEVTALTIIDEITETYDGEFHYPHFEISDDGSVVYIYFSFKAAIFSYEFETGTLEKIFDQDFSLPSRNKNALSIDQSYLPYVADDRDGRVFKVANLETGDSVELGKARYIKHVNHIDDGTMLIYKEEEEAIYHYNPETNTETLYFDPNLEDDQSLISFAINDNAERLAIVIETEIENNDDEDEDDDEPERYQEIIVLEK